MRERETERAIEFISCGYLMYAVHVYKQSELSSKERVRDERKEGEIPQAATTVDQQTLILRNHYLQ